MAELVDATDSKSVELRFMSVRVGLGVPKHIQTTTYGSYPQSKHTLEKRCSKFFK